VRVIESLKTQKDRNQLIRALVQVQGTEENQDKLSNTSNTPIKEELGGKQPKQVKLSVDTVMTSFEFIKCKVRAMGREFKKFQRTLPSGCA
jgi:hypothetical protein